MIKVALMALFVLTVMVAFFMWLHTMPRVPHAGNRVVAGIFILLTLLWFGSELIWGGGDKMK